MITEVVVSVADIVLPNILTIAPTLIVVGVVLLGATFSIARRTSTPQAVEAFAVFPHLDCPIFGTGGV